MERILQATADGSHTVSIPALQVSYHSRHGAIQESMHVFIEAGWKALNTRPGITINVLEMGFGTGLNALLTLIESKDVVTWYETIEKFPLPDETIQELNYCDQLARRDLAEIFLQMHRSEWNVNIHLEPSFTLFKNQTDLQTFETNRKFHLIYFDAFAPTAQPELWTAEIFKKLFSFLETNGILVTYCSKGDVRRAMLEAGFTVEKIPGPPGKREMVRAIKKQSTPSI